MSGVRYEVLSSIGSTRPGPVLLRLRLPLYERESSRVFRVRSQTFPSEPPLKSFVFAESHEFYPE